MAKAGTHSVILTRGASGPFRRVLRDLSADPVGGMHPPLKDEAGNERVLIFNPGQPVDLTAEELEAVRDDIGKVLSIAKTDTESKPVAKPDDEATKTFVEETRQMRADQQKQRDEERRAELERQRNLSQAVQAAAATAPPVKKTPQPAVPAVRTGHRADLESKDR